MKLYSEITAKFLSIPTKFLLVRTLIVVSSLNQNTVFKLRIRSVHEKRFITKRHQHFKKLLQNMTKTYINQCTHHFVVFDFRVAFENFWFDAISKAQNSHKTLTARFYFGVLLVWFVRRLVLSAVPMFYDRRSHSTMIFVLDLFKRQNNQFAW